MALLASATTKTVSGTTTTTNPILAKPIPIVGIPGVDYNPGQNPDRNISNGFPSGVTSNAGINYNPTQNRDRNYDMNIIINTGVGDPNAIAETLDQYLQGAVDRGTLRVR